MNVENTNYKSKDFYHKWVKEQKKLILPIKKFKKDPSAENHYPANGDASLSGVIVDADEETGLAEDINQIIFGGNLKQKI